MNDIEMMSRLKNMIQGFELREAEVSPNIIKKAAVSARRGLGPKGDTALSQAASKFKDLSGGDNTAAATTAGEVAKDAEKTAPAGLPAVSKAQPEVSPGAERVSGIAGKSVGSSGALSRVQAKIGAEPTVEPKVTATSGAVPQKATTSGDYIPKSSGTSLSVPGNSGGAGGDIPGSWKNMGAEPSDSSGGLGKVAKGAGIAGLAGMMAGDSAKTTGGNTHSQSPASITPGAPTSTSSKPAPSTTGTTSSSKSFGKAGTAKTGSAKTGTSSSSAKLSRQEEMELNMLSVDMEKVAASNPEVKAALDKYYSIYGK